MKIEELQLWFKTNKVRTVSNSDQKLKNQIYENMLNLFSILKRLPQIINEEQNNYERDKSLEYINGYKQGVKNSSKRLQKEIEQIL